MRLGQLSFAALITWALICISVHEARTQSSEQFYRNRSIELISASGSGSTYTTWARIVGRYMQQYIPGKPTIVVKTMPGGGGITAANYLFNVAPKDGTSFATISRNLPFTAFLGNKSAKYDPRKFNWIGSVEATVRTCAVMASAGVRTVDDLRHKQVTVGGTGAGSGQSFLPLVVNHLVGTKFKVVEGYRSADDIHLAIERGEVSGICGLHDSTVRRFGDKIRSGQMIVLFNLERQRNPELDGVPSIAEFITDPEMKKIFAFISSPTEMGRPFVAPPGVPSNRLVALKAAFDRTVQDPNFRRDVAKLQLKLQVTTGEQLARIVAELYETPASVVKKAIALMPQSGLR